MSILAHFKDFILRVNKTYIVADIGDLNDAINGCEALFADYPKGFAVKFDELIRLVEFTVNETPQVPTPDKILLLRLAGRVVKKYPTIFKQVQ